MMFRLLVVLVLLFIAAVNVSRTFAVQTAPPLQEAVTAAPPALQEQEEARSWFEGIASDWRRVVMLGGLLAALILSVVSFFERRPLSSFWFLFLFAVLAFGSYYVWQYATLKALHQEVEELKSANAAFREQSERLFKELSEFIERLQLKTDSFEKRSQELGELFQGRMGDLGEEIARMRLCAETLFSRLQELLQEDAIHKKQQELEKLALRLGTYTGRIEAASRQLPRLEGIVCSLEAKLASLASTQNQLSVDEKSISDTAHSLTKSVSEMRELLQGLLEKPL